MSLLFTVFSHQPFPISPSGKSQLFVQVPSVIEFAAEIAAWKISFSLPVDACVCVCVGAGEAHHLLPNWSILFHFPVSMLFPQTPVPLHFGLTCPGSVPPPLLSALQLVLSNSRPTKYPQQNTYILVNLRLCSEMAYIHHKSQQSNEPLFF